MKRFVLITNFERMPRSARSVRRVRPVPHPRSIARAPRACERCGAAPYTGLRSIAVADSRIRVAQRSFPPVIFRLESCCELLEMRLHGIWVAAVERRNQ